VETIDQTAYRLAQQLPDAAIEVAHGQMDEATLSDVWRRLIAGEIDVLVCTTLIETGVDVPNCNTLIVEDADRMGLSQLYQLRGRVGRSGRRAFAYFTFRRDKIITEVAAKRLAAIRDFTSFGSGFKIAMRDLQIRGAGSVLSARQSGHMAAVGYDTYLRILEEAVGDETGKIEAKKRVSCTVDLAVSAYIPESYIADDESRIEMYKRIAAVGDAADAAEALAELQDRFGAVPNTVQALVDVSLIRVMAERLDIYEVKSQPDGGIVFYSDALNMDAASAYMRQKNRRILLASKGKSHLLAAVREGESPTNVAVEVLTGYGAAVSAENFRNTQ
jgi:transcription-repair coupling factor (superfamily II helicase)